MRRSPRELERLAAIQRLRKVNALRGATGSSSPNIAAFVDVPDGPLIVNP